MLNKLIADNLVLSIYQYGSRIYGTATNESDYDYIVIVSDNYCIYQKNLKVNNSHFNFYSSSEWNEMIDKNTIETLEVLCCNPNKYCIKGACNCNLAINKVELRKSISKVVSNSYDKCRKKLTIEKDFSPYIAKKSLWHSIRIMLFGIQCCKYGKIVDFQEANCFYNRIIYNPSNNWEDYKKEWHDYLNNKRTEFRKLTEKEWHDWKINQN